MKASLRLSIAIAFVAGLVGGTNPALAYQTYFNSRCRPCHGDDSITCVGCHHHSGVLSATADQPSYAQGEMVTVTLRGGSMGGWLRGLLYDQNGVEVARATGPTGTGDDGLGNPVIFPIALQAAAPLHEGSYVWTAAWFGAEDSGAHHVERTVPITINVHFDAGADGSLPAQLAPNEMLLRVRPNPLSSQSAIVLTTGAAVRNATLSIVDSGGRLVRELVSGVSGAGSLDVIWNGCDCSGNPVPAGAYFARLTDGANSVSHPVIVLR